MRGLTDIHQHVLWGLDDGAQTPKVMHQMLHAAHEQQIRRIAATPHVYPGFKPFDMELYRRRLDEAQAYCDENKLDIELMSGAPAEVDQIQLDDLAIAITAAAKPDGN